jgi:hypothetical protein
LTVCHCVVFARRGNAILRTDRNKNRGQPTKEIKIIKMTGKVMI